MLKTTVAHLNSMVCVSSFLSMVIMVLSKDVSYSIIFFLLFEYSFLNVCYMESVNKKGGIYYGNTTIKRKNYINRKTKRGS